MKEFDQIVKNASKGDFKAFEQICDIKGKNIVYLCIKSMENVQDGEDAAQEVFIRLQKGISSLKSPSAFNRWLYLLVQNTCNDLRRKNMKNKGDYPIDEVQDFILEEKTEYLPQEVIEDEEKRLQLQKVIDKMSYNMRMSVILFYYEGLTREEIGEVLSLPASTVKTNLYRARIKIRKEIEILEPDYKKSASLMPMIFMNVLFQEDAANIVSKSIIQQCATPAIEIAKVAAGITVGSAVATTATTAATTAATTSLAGVVTAAISVAIAGVCLTATIVSANNPVTSSPGFTPVSESTPQRMEQTGQSVVEDISSSEETFVVAPSHSSSSGFSASGATQNEQEKADSAATENQKENQKYSLSGKVILLDKSNVPITGAKGYTDNIQISIIQNGKTFAQTKTNSQGEYTFSGIPLEQGAYKIKVSIPSERIAEFSSNNKNGVIEVSIGEETNILLNDIAIVNNRAPSIAVLLYDEKQQVTNSNPKEVKVYISDNIPTEYSLEVYSASGELVCQGDKQKIDEFLQSGLLTGKYSMRLVVTDVSKHQAIDQINFYIV